jgi:predicted ester cyclase
MRDIERFAQEGARTLSERNWDAYGALFAADLVMHTPGIPGATRGRQARVDLARGIYEAFPDGRVEPEGVLADGDWACVRLRFSGTNTGPMAGPDGSEIPPTNKAAEFPYCMVMRFEDGEVAELHEYYDQLALLTQLGIA